MSRVGIVCSVLGGLIAVLVLICVLTVVTLGSDFVNFGASHDISNYIQKIEHSNLSEQQKQKLTTRLEAIQSKARVGIRPTFMRWVDYDTAIRGALHDDVITPREWHRLDNNLKNIEAEQAQQKKPW